MAIGPDKKFAYGAPLSRDDRGGLYAGFSVNKKMRIGMMEFGAVVDWLAGPPDQMHQLATVMREKCHEAFGKLSYGELPRG